VQKIIFYLKNFSFPISKTAPLATAIATSGGIPISEINSQTMESKIVSGLYFAGEIVGLDGPTGGYNLQKAFSTGFTAGQATALK
jgi:predicted flavoprotein YhiN